MKSCGKKANGRNLFNKVECRSAASFSTTNGSGFAVSAIALAVALLAASPQIARAASECGVDAAGQDAVTCSGASYATGITYPASTGGLTINLDNPNMVVTGTGVSFVTGTSGVPFNTTVNVTNINSITTAGVAVTVINQANDGLASVNINNGTLTSAGTSTVLVQGNGNQRARAQFTLNGGRVVNTGAGVGVSVATPGASGSVDADIIINGGTIESSGTSAAQTLVNGPNNTGTSRITMTGGAVQSTGANGIGLSARTTGRGLAQVQMTGGTVAASGANGDGVTALSTNGTYAVNVSGGTVTGGSGFGAAIHTSAAAGGTLNIGAGAIINGGASGVAIRDGDANRDGVDEIGGNAAITTAGTLNGAVLLGGGTNSLTVTGGSINGNITGSGADTLNFNLGSNTFTHGAAYTISGLNSLVMTSGTARLDSNVTSNIVNVRGGTLAVNGILTSPSVLVEAPGVLGGSGRITGNVDNRGTVAPGNSIGTLLIAGNYAGNGGTLAMEGVLSGTGSPADRLLITGNATGTTPVRVINLGGTGALTGSSNTDGISIIQVGGASTATTFQLQGGYAVAGPYQYRLSAFAPGASAAAQADPLLGSVNFWDYRLQSLVDASGAPIPVPQISAYRALPSGAVQYGASLIGSLHQRLGDTAHHGSGGTTKGAPESFVRVRTERSDFKGDRGPDYKQDSSFAQVGGNILGWDSAEGSLRVGAALSDGSSDLKVGATGASVKLDALSLALTATWRSVSGLYLDAIAQSTRYKAAVTTDERGRTADPKGYGHAVSIEAGASFPVRSNVVFEPQMQWVYQRNTFDTFTDVDGVSTNLSAGKSLRGGLGGRLKMTRENDPASNAYVEAHVTREFLNAKSIDAAGVAFASDLGGTTLRMGTGVNWRLERDTFGFAQLGLEKGLGNGTADTWSAQVGLKVAF